MATVKQQIQQGIREMLLRYTDCKAKNVVCGFNNRVSQPDENDFIIFNWYFSYFRSFVFGVY